MELLYEKKKNDSRKFGASQEFVGINTKNALRDEGYA